ncbi:helix-turn-helix domain-containing protein [Desulforamulus aquiferis]|uniref:Helix-turn-helix domain-containing protein n=1 Tax=Desulforamulus aquiferis TaxID=1397668 RepID=A0AAW7ZEX4_9FIRM|nr:helix-turn-helix domain-containing protein [Desulforamulus aquiferis]MDO7788288.1 helix-turn-helix domain-containing protein [Desulforamulus aquiferis]
MVDKLNSVIAENLKKLREERKLSLESVAKLSGVSKSMLGQIERGDVNPTVSTIWKISNGLKISFTQLMSRPESDIELVYKSEIQPLVEDNGKLRNFPIFPFDSTRRFEMYTLEIDGGGLLNAEAHPQGTQEFITVFFGEVVITVNGEDFVITEGNSMRFKADCPHDYKNLGKKTCKLSMIIYYPM